MTMKRWMTSIWTVCWFSAVAHAQAAPPASRPVTVVNHSRFPVHSTAIALDEAHVAARLGLEAGKPWRLRDSQGLRISRRQVDGRAVTYAHVSLGPQSRLDLLAEPARAWAADEVARASGQRQPARDKRIAGFCDGTHEIVGRLENGVVTAEFDRSGWRLGFAAPETHLVVGGQVDFWVDDQDRGRIMNSDPRQLGLARYEGSTIEQCDAAVRPDGMAVLTVVRRMGGLARAMKVVETFELPPSLPVLVCRIRWENTGDKPLWIAYAGSGDGIKGKWGQPLMARPLIERKKSPLLGDLDGGETRCAWLGGLCRISMECPQTGCGVGLSTVLPTPGKVGQGSMIWGCGAGGFQCNFIDPVQGQFPFKVEPRGKLENGIAVLAVQGGTSAFRDTVELWRTIQAGKRMNLSSPVAVYIGGVPAAAQTLSEMTGPLDLLAADGPVRRVAVRMDFNRHFECRLVGEGPIELLAIPMVPTGKPVPLLNAEKAGTHTIYLNAKTAWKDEAAFILEARLGAGAKLTGLFIVETLPTAPQPLSPLPDASFTDLATMFRWRAIPLVVDYDLQWSAAEDFAKSVDVRISTSDPFPWYLPPEAQLPAAGRYWWRVRGVKGAVLGAWSPARGFTVNTDRTTKPVARPMTAERPLFTVEASKVTDFTNFSPDFPCDLAPYLGIIAEGYVDKGLTIDQFVQGLEKLPYAVMVRSHPPTWVNLADLEWLCQNLPNFVGIQGGETLSNLCGEPRGKTANNGDADYHRRMTVLCAKYGKVYHEADGTYRDDKWQDLLDKQGPFVRTYGPWLVLSQKNNIIRRQFYSQSAAMGLWLGGLTHQHGAWEDGGFYWQNAGFAGMGTCLGERKGVLKTMPRNFWSLVFVMGISRGCGVYALDGQTLMYSPKELERWPDQVPRAVIWDTTGKTSQTFNRYVVPLIRGAVEHKLVPTREQVLANVRLAVFNDMKGKGDLAAWPHYMEYGPLYAATYGFRTMGNIDGQLWEFFPNTGRYYYIPTLVQGDQPLAAGVRNVPLSLLQSPDKVRQIFDAAYPKWYEGDALACLVGDTITVQNTHENVDATESFALPLHRGLLVSLAGKLPPQAYLVGKIEDQGRRLWLQSNAELGEREMELSIGWAHKPQCAVEPAASLKQMTWDESTKRLVLQYTHDKGSVEVTLK